MQAIKNKVPTSCQKDIRAVRKLPSGDIVISLESPLANVTVLAQLHIWHKSHTLPGSSICTVACLLCYCLVAYLAQVTHLAGKFHLHCYLFAPLLPDSLPIRTSPAPPASSLLFFFSSFLVFCLVYQSKSQVSSQVRSRLLNQLGLSSALPLPCRTTKDLPNYNTLHQAMFTSLSCLNNQTKPCQLLEITSSFATCLQSSCEFKLLTLLPSPSLNTLLTQRSSVVIVETRKSRMRSLRASSCHCHSR